MAKKVVTKTIVSLTFAKCKPHPIGMKTSNKFSQLAVTIALKDS